MSDSSCMLEGMFQSRRFSIFSALGGQNWLAVDSSKAKVIFKALVTLSVKWSVLKIVTYDRVCFSFGSFVILHVSISFMRFFLPHTHTETYTCTYTHRLVCSVLKSRMWSCEVWLCEQSCVSTESGTLRMHLLKKKSWILSVYVQIGWHIHISTLNDHKKSQSQLGGIRRLPSVSHKRHQLRATACFTNMRCIVVIKEALQYKPHTSSSIMFSFFSFFF